MSTPIERRKAQILAEEVARDGCLAPEAGEALAGWVLYFLEELEELGGEQRLAGGDRDGLAAPMGKRPAQETPTH